MTDHLRRSETSDLIREALNLVDEILLEAPQYEGIAYRAKAYMALVKRAEALGVDLAGGES